MSLWDLAAKRVWRQAAVIRGRLRPISALHTYAGLTRIFQPADYHHHHHAVFIELFGIFLPGRVWPSQASVTGYVTWEPPSPRL